MVVSIIQIFRKSVRSVIKIKGGSVGIGEKAFIQVGYVKRAIPGLTQYEGEVEADPIKNQDPAPVFTIMPTVHKYRSRFLTI